MPLNANKGEWSEFYAFLKILSEKELHSADESLILIPDSVLKVLAVIRQEDSISLVYEINDVKNQIIIKKNNEIIGVVPIFQVSEKLNTILKKIKRGAESKRVFSISEANDLMKELKCQKIKSSANKKADINLKIEECRTNTKPVRGFSIKSKIGGMSTLLNASGATNFEYEIFNNNAQTDYSKALISLNRILTERDSLKFNKVIDKNFRNNLMMIDSHMDVIIAEILKGYYLKKGGTIEELTRYVEKTNPLNVSHEHFYEYKIKKLLTAVALGMQPSKLWDGTYETHGGYIIVKENGELACYHIYDIDRFRQFLFANTKFETPSRERHKFGKIYEKDGKRYICLNLQIRFMN